MATTSARGAACSPHACSSSARANRGTPCKSPSSKGIRDAVAGRRASPSPKLHATRNNLQRAASRQREILRGEVPVEQLVDQRVHVIVTPVLVIEVVGMLPHVDREERNLPSRERHLGVRRGGHLELAAVD